MPVIFFEPHYETEREAIKYKVFVLKITFRRSSDLEKHSTIKNCDKIFLRLKICLKNDVSTLAKRHYIKSNQLQSINTKKNNRGLKKNSRVRLDI